MLESPTLLVRPSDPSGVRAIVDTATRKPLGYARPGRRPWWGLGPAVLEVHEQEDEPLLFTLRRGWGLTPRHEVRDAEGMPVGLVDGRFLRDGWGRCVAVGPAVPGLAAQRAGHVVFSRTDVFDAHRRPPVTPLATNQSDRPALAAGQER